MEPDDTTPSVTPAPVAAAAAPGHPGSELEEVRQRARTAAMVRAALGAIPLLAPGPAAKVFGFPAAQDTPAARFFARLFGVRELALAAMVLTSLDDRDELGQACAISAAVDAGDAAVAAAVLRRGEGLRRPAVAILAAGVAGTAVWLDLLRRIDD